MSREPELALLRIGELSRRVGVSVHVLRAWETRYGLLRPQRSSGRFRLYSGSEEARIRTMQGHLAAGLSAAEAARATLAEAASIPAGAATPEPAEHADRLVALLGGLRHAFDDLDEPAAQGAVDQLLAEFTVETALKEVVHYLHDLGERWDRGEVSVAQEHFASNVLRGRLCGLARGWGDGHGLHALLACPPGELHDLGVMVFGVALRRAGWRVSYLGADTPLDALVDALDRIGPDVLVLAATAPERFTHVAGDLSRLAQRRPLAIAGAGASRAVAGDIGARLLAGDPVSAAGTLHA
jgi:methanogenic corrinoid protein MtbC1